MFARGNLILGVVLTFLFLCAVPIALYISNLDKFEEIDRENSKRDYVNGLLLGLRDMMPNCPDPILVGNGVCNEVTNIKECDFDGMDCPTTTTTTTTTTTRTTCHDWTKVESLEDATDPLRVE